MPSFSSINIQHRPPLNTLLSLIVLMSLLLLTGASFNNNHKVDAVWTVNLPGGRTSIFETNLGGVATDVVLVLARNNIAKFDNAMQNDRSVFPGNCFSDQPNLPYGWERYKNDMIKPLSVTVNLGIITINIYPRLGFSVTTEETITCGPFESEFGEPYYLGGALAKQDQSFSFVISRAPSVSVSLYKVVDKSRPYYEACQSTTRPDTQQLDEGSVRDLGLKVYILLINDNWDASKVKDVGQYLKCADAATKTAFNCFQGMVTDDMFNYTDDEPNVVSLVLNRDQTRLFNINERAHVWFELPDNGKGYTMKNVDINQDSRVNTFTITFNPAFINNANAATSPLITLYGADFIATNINPATGQPYRRLKDPADDRLSQITNPKALTDNVYSVPESCLRGKDWTVSSCNRTILAYVFQDSNFVNRFGANSGFTRDDIRNHMLISQYAFMNETNWFDNIYLSDTQGLFVMNIIPEYETWADDYIEINIPFSSFATKEPPVPLSGTPLKLHVIPSPGAYVGGLRDMEQKEIWRSEVVQRLVLDGESWTQASLDNLFNNVAGDGTMTLGFNAQKAELFSLNVSVYYPLTKWGRPNTTIMEMRWKRMPEYEMNKPWEIVYFTISNSWIRSNLSLAINGPISFNITKSPGELTVAYNPLVEEAVMIEGGYQLNLTLAGDRWVNAGNTLRSVCLPRLCPAWNSSRSVADDPNGWTAQGPPMCDPDNITLLEGNRTLVITLVGNPDYNTKRGEIIGINVPIECSAAGVKPILYWPLEVLPQNGYVDFWVSYDDGVSVQNLSEISEGDLREAKAMIIVRTRGDNWDERPSQKANVSASVFNNTLADAFGTFGWNNKKSEMIAEPISNLMKVETNGLAYNITYRFKPVSTFDLAANETVTLDLKDWWMASGRTPIIPSINFTIYASPGVIELVEWAGSGDNFVTEDDIRWGRVWFQFRIVGEQWRRDNAPFINSFSSNDTSPTAFNNLVKTLIPAIQFFNFTVTPDGFEYLRLTLQSQELYDIDQPENVTISLDPQTVVSGIQPVFDFAGVRTANFSFIIYPDSARVLMSGAVYKLNEKQMRQSTSTIVFLTLIGDTWRNGTWDNETASFFIRQELNASAIPATSLNTRGYVKLNESILPSTSISRINPHVLELRFIPDRTYKLNTTEVLNINVIPDPPEPEGTTTSTTTATSTTSTTTETETTTTSTSTTTETTTTTSTTIFDPNATVLTTIAPTTTAGPTAPPAVVFPKSGVQPPLELLQPAVTSYYPPHFVRELKLYIDAAGGELRFAMENPVITERILRSQRFVFAVAIDGDTILYNQISSNKRNFVMQGLASSSSILAEPEGFTNNRDLMLNVQEPEDEPLIQQGTDYTQIMTKSLENITGNSTNMTTTTAAPNAPPAPIATTSTMAPNSTNGTNNNIFGITSEPLESSFSFAIFNTPLYNIRNDEKITLTMDNPSFFGTGIAADPSSITLTVQKVPQIMTCLIDVSVSFARTFEIDKLALKTRLSKLLALPLERVETQVHPTERQLRGLLNMRVWFVDDDTIGTTGYLTNAYLTDTFLSLSPDYHYSAIAAREVFLEEFPPIEDPNAGASTNAAGELGSQVDPVWGIVGGVFIILGAVVFGVALVLQKAKLSLSSLRPAKTRTVFKSEGKYEVEQDEEMKAKEEEYNANIDERVLKQTASPFFVGRSGKAKANALAADMAKKKGFTQQSHEGIQVTTQPMSLREYMRKELAKKDGNGGGITVGLDALGLSPKDVRNPGISLDEEMAGDRDHLADIAEEEERRRREYERNNKYHSVEAADRRNRIDRHHNRHAFDHTKVIDLLADL